MLYEVITRFVDAIRPEFAPLTIEEMFFAPRQVSDRLSELGRSLLLGIAIVGGILLVIMGPRMGLVVALILPLVTLSSLSLVAMGGGVLHQMAVAGLVIALGMLVDNAIVIVITSYSIHYTKLYESDPTSMPYTQAESSPVMPCFSS